ncbi:MAG TPA: DUF3224 domain-containing protein [Candidatus Saccharimonadales bacterium]|nr:DUF3224 domain-containing protein [Candidatus Saccharimonadales bacterium]
MKHATGSFEVKIVPEEASAAEKAAGIARMSIDKVVSGDLAGSTKGEMLTSTTAGTGAMAYVAIETVRATLDGRSGTFVLIHKATMNKNDPKSQSLNITVAPSSGTEGLAGIAGDFSVHIDGTGKHTYTFDYELP